MRLDGRVVEGDAACAGTPQKRAEWAAEFKCLHTHFRNSGDWCSFAGVPPFEGAVEAQGAGSGQTRF